jgi:tetratricopeptide (TPR) repeat protein
MQSWNNVIVGNNVNISYDTALPQTALSLRVILPPRLVNTLYGRADIFTQVTQELDAGKPVVLHGMAGMGKSALASVVAWSLVSKYPNGVLWVDGGYNPIDTICDNVGQQLEDDQMPKLAAGAKPSRVRYLLGLHKVLVVLDDCWDSDVARDFAQTCVPAGSALLVTSREKIARLGVLVEVHSLKHNSAIELFKDVAGIVHDKYDESITELVSLLGGHPQGLAIAGALCLEEELSAKELLRLLGPAEERAKRLKLGKDTSNNVWATFDLSYQRLKSEEQIVFKALGGSWAKSATPEILSLIISSDVDVIESALRGLVKRALARVEELPSGIKRYIIHDLIHGFSQGLVKESGQPIQDLYRNWLTAIVKYSQKYSGDDNSVHNALEAELGNILGAANWASENNQYNAVDSLAHILCSSSSFLYRRGFNSQAVALSQRAIEAAKALGNKKSEGIHLGNLGYAFALLSNYPKAIECYQQALLIARAIGDGYSESKWLGSIGLVYDNIGDFHKAVEFYERAVELDRKIDNEVGEGRWLGSLAGTYRTLGDGEKATTLYTQAINLARKMGDRANECTHLSNLGNAYRTWGKYEDAIQYYSLALDIALQIGDRATQARCLVNSGRLLARLNRPLDGLDQCRKALEIFTEIGFRSGEAYAHGYIGEVMRTLGNNEDAKDESLRALEIHRELGVQNGQGDWLHNLGVWALEDGRDGEGIAYLQEALAIRKKLGIAKVDDTLNALKRFNAI